MNTANTIILATSNAGKIRELATALHTYGLQVIGLSAFPDLEPVEETGITFEENALLKAHAVSKATGLVSIADDSGLEVDALHGAPGVHSARFSDDMEFLPHETKDQRNMRKLLATMHNIPEGKRHCRFVCAMAAAKPSGEHLVLRGTWEGQVLTAMRGTNGFGYDPVFFDAQYNKSAAELTLEEKNARSHRGNALRALLAQWNTFYNKS